jgi:hypothetical protein
VPTHQALAGVYRSAQRSRRAFDTYETHLRPFIHAKQSGAERFISFFATRT